MPGKVRQGGKLVHPRTVTLDGFGKGLIHTPVHLPNCR
jgi:hypothetical protein